MEQNKDGILIVLSGPSGVGKGTINRELCGRNCRIKNSVSATTRAKRPGEIEGVHYFFKSPSEFETMVARGDFLEYMHVFGMNYYGTPKQYVEEERCHGFDVILEIDVQGGMRVKEVCPDAVMIFIAPPSMGELKSRLIGRGTEMPEVVERRFAMAIEEMTYLSRYDYIVVNDVVEKAVHQIENIVAAEKSRVCRNRGMIQKFLQQVGREQNL